MDDMQAFEREIAGVIQRAIGPARPVDAMSVARAASTQSPTWRFQSMVSATKFVVAGAIVALFGGFLLIAQPFEQNNATVPGAATDEAAPLAAVVSGRFEAVSAYDPEDGESYGNSLDEVVFFYRDVAIEAQAEMSDERLSGEVTGTWNVNIFSANDDPHACDTDQDVPSTCVRLDWGTLNIDNDDGTWVGRWVRQFAEPQVWFIELVGTEGYEGWSAILSTTDDMLDPGQSTTWSVSGTVFNGNQPPDREAYLEREE